MIQQFIVQKSANNYADTLEAYGLAQLLSKICAQLMLSRKISIAHHDSHYGVLLNKPIMLEELEKLSYFPVLQFIKKKADQKVPEGIGRDYYDYPLQQSLKKQKEVAIQATWKQYKDNNEVLKQKLQAIEQKYQSEQVAEPIKLNHDIVSQIIQNPYTNYNKLYNNFNQNQAYFQDLLFELLNQYTHQLQLVNNYSSLVKSKEIKLSAPKSSSGQLIAPHKGKGLNKSKAAGIGAINPESSWMQDTMRFLGLSSNSIIAQNIKVGSSYDLKLFVPVFNQVTLSKKQAIVERFKRHAKSNSPIKLDLINLIKFSQIFIETTPAYKGKLKDSLVGIHAVYQKDLGQNKAVANISFLGTPSFISIQNQAEARTWVDILEEQIQVLQQIDETKSDTTLGLLYYRNFLIGGQLSAYFKFNYWYASYLMQKLTKENNKRKYIQHNTISTLTKFFLLMDTSLNNIINNEGFLAIADAIRKSTVSLQYTPKEQRQFAIQYGLAQKLQNKAKSTADLVTFVGEFVAKYNTDTARHYEKTQKALRAMVKDAELEAFFELAAQTDSKILGAMLAAYGFALKKKATPSN